MTIGVGVLAQTMSAGSRRARARAAHQAITAAGIGRIELFDPAQRLDDGGP